MNINTTERGYKGHSKKKKAQAVARRSDLEHPIHTHQIQICQKHKR